MRCFSLATATGLLLVLLTPPAGSSAWAQRSTGKVLAGRLDEAPEPRLLLPSFIKFPDNEYALTSEFKFTFRVTRRSVRVPAGFVTDFASIPFLAQPLLSKEQHDLPGLVHDFLYWRHSCTREEADRLFEAALAQMGVPKTKRTAMFLAVRAAGESAWNENADDRTHGLPRVIPREFMQIPAMSWKDYREQLRQHRVLLDAKDQQPPDFCRSAVTKTAEPNSLLARIQNFRIIPALGRHHSR